MAELRRLSPGTHLIHGIRARTNSLDECIEEFVDNSLEHGGAKNVTIVIANKGGIVIQDDGAGVSDINRVFEIASSSAYDDKSKLSQYGVGAKDSAIWLGDELTIKTVYGGRFHTRTVNWNGVIKNGWPFAYDKPGRPAGNQPQGTTLIIKEPRHHFQLKSSERLARKLGSTFSSAIRDGVKMTVLHELAGGGQRQVISVVPFTPPGLTDRTEISGTVKAGKGELTWHGVAGLAQGLNHETNGVHIYFRHRRIETNRLPFQGASAPTLYCEVYLDAETGWKRSLSDHKKKITTHREALMQSIHDQIEPLLKKASEQSLSVTLSKISLPIEAQLTKALKGDGDLFIDPNSEGEYGDGSTATGTEPRAKPVHDVVPGGERAKPGGKPTGIKINWRNADYLQDGLWNWQLSGKQLVIEMDKDHYRALPNLDSDMAQKHIMESAVQILSYALEQEYLKDPDSLAGVVAPSVRRRLHEWHANGFIAPRLNRALSQGRSTASRSAVGA